MVGLGDGPPFLRVDSEEILLTLTDERAQLAHAVPGITPVDSSEIGAPVCELIWPSVLAEPLVDCLQEPMPGEKSLDEIRATASVWSRCIVLSPAMRTLTLLEWHPGTPAECIYVHVVSRIGL